MRLYDDNLAPALLLCRRSAPRAAPDCAQGAYHDYWFAVIGADETSMPEDAVTDPRALCGAQPAAFVRPCWYRAFLENRTGGLAGRVRRGPRVALRRAERPAALRLRDRRGA